VAQFQFWRGNFNSGEDEIDPLLLTARGDRSRDFLAILNPQHRQGRKVFFKIDGQAPCKHFAGGTPAHLILVVSIFFGGVLVNATLVGLHGNFVQHG